MVSLLGRIIGPQPPPEFQGRALEILAYLGTSDPVDFTAPALGASIPTVSAATAANRRLVYVHGICRHGTRFSDPWWSALQPFVSNTFGAGDLGVERLEVIWSDLVNTAASALTATIAAMNSATTASATASAGDPSPISRELARRQAADEIKEAIRDRTDQQIIATGAATEGFGAAPQSADMGALISIPGLNCIDDFSLYLTDQMVRQNIIERFLSVVRSEMQAGRELDIVSHSWGTVVAYEALRQLEDEGSSAPLVRNFFTVGAALSIGPVKMRLRPANRNGRKPANVRRWINLDARGDVVGGPLKGRPYAVDLDFVNLSPVGCSSFFGLVNPQCAHSSYFDTGNTIVNKDIFGHHIIAS